MTWYNLSGPVEDEPEWDDEDEPEWDDADSNAYQSRVEAEAAAEAEAWGGRGPSASYAEWLAEGQQEPEAGS